MNCPNCKNRMKIVDTRLYGGNIRIRRYKCDSCGFEAKTSEELKDE